MSHKSSIFLTQDNEHCYFDGISPHFAGNVFLGYCIVMEMDKKNIEILCNDNENLVISIKPGSELYSHIRTINEE